MESSGHAADDGELDIYYFVEMRPQCDSFFDAAHRPARLIGHQRSSLKAVRSDQLFFSAQHVTNAAAMVSKLLNPAPRGKNKAAGMRRGKSYGAFSTSWTTTS